MFKQLASSSRVRSKMQEVRAQRERNIIADSEAGEQMAEVHGYLQQHVAQIQHLNTLAGDTRVVDESIAASAAEMASLVIAEQDESALANLKSRQFMDQTREQIEKALTYQSDIEQSVQPGGKLSLYVQALQSEVRDLKKQVSQLNCQLTEMKDDKQVLETRLKDAIDRQKATESYREKLEDDLIGRHEKETLVRKEQQARYEQVLQEQKSLDSQLIQWKERNNQLTREYTQKAEALARLEGEKESLVHYVDQAKDAYQKMLKQLEELNQNLVNLDNHNRKLMSENERLKEVQQRHEAIVGKLEAENDQKQRQLVQQKQVTQSLVEKLHRAEQAKVEIEDQNARGKAFKGRALPKLTNPELRV